MFVKTKHYKHSGEHKPAKAADSAKFLQFPIHAVARIPLKNSWIQIMIQIGTKIEWFVVSETPTPQKCHKNSATASCLISKICTIAHRTMVKNSWICIVM